MQTGYSIKGAAKPTSDNSHPEVLDTWVRTSVSATLLDIGCGGGSFLLKAAIKGLSVYGVDADMRMVLATRSKLKHGAGTIIQGLIGEDTPEEWPKFDYVTSFEVLEHSEDITTALVWILNLIKKDGWLIGSVPEGNKLKLSEGKLLSKLPETDEDLIYINKHKNAFRCEDMNAILCLAGFTKVEVKRTAKGSKKRLVFRGARI